MRLVLLSSLVATRPRVRLLAKLQDCVVLLLLCQHLHASRMVTALVAIVSMEVA